MTDIVTDDKNSVVLETSATLIEMNGWTVGAWGRPGQKMCLEGGIIAAMGYDLSAQDDVSPSMFNGCSAYNAVREYLRENEKDWVSDNLANPESNWDLFFFNDDDGVSSEKVIATLRGAAQREREAGR